MKIIFFGTPDFAVASLQKIMEAGFEVAAVVTAPDKQAGRGLKLQQSAVKQFAVEHNLPVLQPEKLKNPDFIEELRAYNVDLFVIIAFRMLPEAVWNMPPLGSINLHGSLLPQYRGAAPINWAVINGEKETGVTTFFLKHQIDTGSIILRDKIEIAETDTAGTVHDKLMVVGAELMVRTLTAIESNSYTLEEQDLSVETKHAPKIFKDDCLIDFSKPTEAVYNFIRGLSPYPTAWTKLGAQTLKVFWADKEIDESTAISGTLLSDNKKYIKVACADGWLSLKDIQLEGKKRMGVEEFLRGFDISTITKLG
ncbi:methionyl-tRNA formyltransferase [Oscillatoria amoena NRMC-F 0135]|nr:methionyl-tRNA formyltransferase [Oscillatoria amoena NRMC-F 0135]